MIYVNCYSQPQYKLHRSLHIPYNPEDEIISYRKKILCGIKYKLLLKIDTSDLDLNLLLADPDHLDADSPGHLR